MEVHLAIKLVYWREATSWLFTKRGGVEPGTTGNKSKPEVRTGFEPGAAAYKPNALTTGPHCLLEGGGR